MTYEEISKFVFNREIIDWEQRDSKKRDRPLVEARQTSIFLGNWFYPKITWAELGKMFSRDHATAMHSVRAVKNEMATNKSYRIKVHGYINEINARTVESREAEIDGLLKIKDVDTLKSLLDTISQMELVAKVYCKITNQKIINDEN